VTTTIRALTKVNKGLDMFLPWMALSCLCSAVGRGTHEGCSTEGALFLGIVDVEDECVLHRVVDKVPDQG
jgi:hypothetical protein